jgi:hypothetical protein
MGDKNHSTVILANRRISRQLQADEIVRRQTPAGIQEERLQVIVHKLEKQLGKAGADAAAGNPPPAPDLSRPATEPSGERARADSSTASRVAIC